MKTALVIIDIQNDYFPGGRNELVDAREAAKNASKLITAGRARNMSVVHVRHISKHEGANLFSRGQRGFVHSRECTSA